MANFSIRSHLILTVPRPLGPVPEHRHEVVEAELGEAVHEVPFNLDSICTFDAYLIESSLNWTMHQQHGRVNTGESVTKTWRSKRSVEPCRWSVAT
jgi:hypothetical protein